MVAKRMSESPDPNEKRRWPRVQPNALKNASIGILTATLTLTIYWFLVVGSGASNTLIITFVLCTVMLSGLFVLLGESPIEDGVKSAMILFLGVLFLFLTPFRASWCFAPGFAAIVGTIVNATMQSTIGRYF